MATKKIGKKTGKKTDKKASDRSGKTKKVKVPYEPNADRIVYFMNSLIQAGYVGKTIAKESRGRKEASMALRQMAQQLDRQVHKSTT